MMRKAGKDLDGENKERKKLSDTGVEPKVGICSTKLKKILDWDEPTQLPLLVRVPNMVHHFGLSLQSC